VLSSTVAITANTVAAAQLINLHCCYTYCCCNMYMKHRHMPGFAGEDPENLKLQELWSAVFSRTAFLVKLPMVNVERVLKKAYEWIELVAKEMGWSGDILQRRKEVRKQAQFIGSVS
jgi:hypothetical protein